MKGQTPAGHKEPCVIWALLSNPGSTWHRSKLQPTELLSLSGTRAPCCPLFLLNIPPFYTSGLISHPGFDTFSAWRLLWSSCQGELKLPPWAAYKTPIALLTLKSQLPHNWILISVKMETMSNLSSNAVPCVAHGEYSISTQKICWLHFKTPPPPKKKILSPEIAA